MDINGTRFHLCTGENYWEPLLRERSVKGLWWDRERRSLGLIPHIVQIGRRPGENILTPGDRRGAARDYFGNIYWIGDDQRHVVVLPSGTEDAGDFWAVNDLFSIPQNRQEQALFQPEAQPVHAIPLLRGLAVTKRHYMVVGTLEPCGLLLFDLHAGGTPLWMRWPEETSFSPFDICASADGGVWILDRDASGENASIWKLDCHLRVEPVDDRYRVFQLAYEKLFSPEGEESHARGARYLPEPNYLDGGSPLPVHNPCAVESLGDGSLLVLAESESGKYSIIHRFRRSDEINRIELEGEILSRVLREPNLSGHDMAFVGEETELPGTAAGTLTIVGRDGNQAYAFAVFADGGNFDIRILPRYIPMRRFGGKALLAGPAGALYDIGKRWFPLAEQPRRRYESGEEIDGLVFDGKEPGCVWHRIVLDASIPAGTSVTFESRCDDDKEALIYRQWLAEPALVLRGNGSEVVHYEPFTKRELTSDGTGTWELLIRNAKGRRLELRMRLSGNGRATPRVRALRVYYPRFSYLEKYLPAVYRENQISAGFLERYLANVEGIFSDLEQHVASFHDLLDTRTAPPEYLEWLANLLGMMLSSEWSQARRRLFVDNAVMLFRRRGTQIGMRALLRLALEPCPDETVFDELRTGQSCTPLGRAGGASIRIIERYLYRHLPGVSIGDPTEPGELKTTVVSNTLSERGTFLRLNERYRRFLRMRYSQGMQTQETTPIEALNAEWDTHYVAFTEIEFTPQARNPPPCVLTGCFFYDASRR
ncbi:MAG: hypothetical protein GF344_12500 [Chitinivibrionales bacterium]|nr:hypothetical protein [Chitinivibrionales bacterium]MBD3357576.1 hypothetical protein [Chitinivibrionales bacterium]